MAISERLDRFIYDLYHPEEKKLRRFLGELSMQYFRAYENEPSFLLRDIYYRGYQAVLVGFEALSRREGGICGPTSVTFTHGKEAFRGFRVYEIKGKNELTISLENKVWHRVRNFPLDEFSEDDLRRVLDPSDLAWIITSSKDWNKTDHHMMGVRKNGGQLFLWDTQSAYGFSLETEGRLLLPYLWNMNVEELYLRIIYSHTNPYRPVEIITFKQN